jgi:hypothetical protein
LPIEKQSGSKLHALHMSAQISLFPAKHVRRTWLLPFAPTEIVRRGSCVPRALPLAIFASSFRGVWGERRAILSAKPINMQDGTFLEFGHAPAVNPFL